MGDRNSFEDIANSKDPANCKELGRRVGPWDEELWQKYVCAVAKDVMCAKFGLVEGFREYLLGISKWYILFMGSCNNHMDKIRWVGG